MRVDRMEELVDQAVAFRYLKSLAGPARRHRRRWRRLQRARVGRGRRARARDAARCRRTSSRSSTTSRRPPARASATRSTRASAGVRTDSSRCSTRSASSPESPNIDYILYHTSCSWGAMRAEGPSIVEVATEAAAKLGERREGGRQADRLRRAHPDDASSGWRARWRSRSTSRAPACPCSTACRRRRSRCERLLAWQANRS